MQPPINAILEMLDKKTKTPWFANPNTAIWVLIFLSIWQFGSSMIIFASGLKQIPESYYEAARMDGASTWDMFCKITIPLLSPIILFNLIMQLISAFMTFTQSFVITGGKQLDSTLFYALYIHQNAFVYQDMGYVSVWTPTL